MLKVDSLLPMNTLLKYIKTAKSNLLLFFNNKVSNVNEFRNLILKFSFCIAFILTFCSIPILLFFGLYHVAIFNLCTAAISVLGLLLIRINKQLFAAALLYFYIILSHSACILFNIFEFDLHIIFALSSISFIFIFLIESKHVSILLFLFAIGVLIGLLNYKNLPFIDLCISLSSFFIFYYVLNNLMINLQSTITKENEINKKLNKSLIEKNNKIQLFTNILVHDIKSPLNNIKGFCSLIHKELQNQVALNKTLHYSENALSSIDSLQILIDELLEYSRTDTSKLEQSELNLNKIAQAELAKLNFQISSLILLNINQKMHSINQV